MFGCSLKRFRMRRQIQRPAPLKRRRSIPFWFRATTAMRFYLTLSGGSARQTAVLLLLTVCIVCGCADQKKQARLLVSSSLLHREASRHAEAIQDLNRALALNPQSSEAWYLRALSHAALSHSEDAVEDFEAAVRVNPDWDEAWLALGVARRADGEPALAIKALSEAIRLNPRMGAAYFDRAQAYAIINEPENSIDDLESALKVDPGNEAALMLHARLILQSRPEDAVADLTHLIARNQNNVDAWLLRGFARQAAGDIDRAIADMNIACRLKPDDYSPWLERGRMLREQGRLEDAISDLSSASKIGVTVPECQYELAMALIQAGRTEDAETSLGQALAADERHIDGRIARAELRVKRGAFELGMEDLDQLSALDLPEADRASLSRRIDINRLRALQAMNRQPEALELIATMLQKTADDADLLQMRADLLKSSNRPDEALDVYTHLISHNPRSEQFLMLRGTLHAESQHWDEAIADFSDVIERDPNSVNCLLARSAVYEQKSENALAVNDLTAAISSAPENVTVLRRRAALFEKMGESSAALSDWQKVVELEPGDIETARIVVQRLRSAGNLSSAVALLDGISKLQLDSLPAPLSLLRGELLLESGDTKAAETVLSRLAESDGNSTAVQILRARVAVVGNQDSVALSILSQIPESELMAEGFQLRGTVEFRQGQLAEAEASLTKSLALNPDNNPAQLLRAEIYQTQKDWKNAVADATAVLSRDGHSLAALKIRGVSAFEMKHFQDAIQDLENPALRPSDTPDLQWIRCQCLMEIDQKFRAREELNALLTNSPAHMQARLMRAKLAEHSGEFEVAVGDLSYLMKQQPNDGETRMLRGLLQHRRGLYAEAVADFTAVLETQPENADTHFRRALAYNQMSKTDLAIVDLKTCLELNPKLADAYYVQGNISAAAGKTQEAKESYQKAVETNPSYAAAWYNLGNLLFNESSLDAAVAAWTKAIEFQPNLFRAYNNRAAALVKLERSKEAIPDYEKATELSPGFARAWDNYAWLLATSEDPEIRDTTRAVSMAKKACELTSHTDWNCLSTLAAAYAEAGDMEQALTWARECEELAPEEEKAEIQLLVQAYQNNLGLRATSSTAVRANELQKK